MIPVIPLSSTSIGCVGPVDSASVQLATAWPTAQRSVSWLSGQYYNNEEHFHHTTSQGFAWQCHSYWCTGLYGGSLWDPAWLVAWQNDALWKHSYSTGGC